MKISGVIPLRNVVKLGYPFELAIQSLRHFCHEVVVLVDPTSEDDTMQRVRELEPDVIVESRWDMTNHRGHVHCEISVQTAKACAAASGDWILSLQADEVLHEAEVAALRDELAIAERLGVSGIELRRLYFYGSLDRVRLDWSLFLLRLFKRGRWKPDVDGAMRFDPVHPFEARSTSTSARIFHYSRVGDATAVAERVRNLDRFFHAPQLVQAGPLQPYDFGALRKLDTYVVGHAGEIDTGASLSEFPLGAHPASALEYFGGPQR